MEDKTILIRFCHVLNGIKLILVSKMKNNLNH